MLAGLGLAGGMAGGLMPLPLRAEEDPSAGLYPVPRNSSYVLDRELTSEELVSSYNNFYEFGSHKRIAAAAQKLPIRPWVLKIDGLCDNPQEIGIDDLLKKMPLEERLYRHRCVEAWSMAVPWSGFALAELVKLASPKAGAKYVRMETFQNPDVATGQKQTWYPWPYVEGMTLAEATNELAFMATGVYGKPLPKQSGAPLRLALPWKSLSPTGLSAVAGGRGAFRDLGFAPLPANACAIPPSDARRRGDGCIAQAGTRGRHL